MTTGCVSIGGCMVRKKEPKYLSGDGNRVRRRISRRQERRTAKVLGGRETVGSGSKGMKGDVWAGDPEAGQQVMVECKATTGKQITLKLAWLVKLFKEAFQAGREPALVVTFEAMEFGAKDWAVIPLDRYRELLDVEAAQKKATDSQ